MASQKRIVILGGSYGGVSTAHYLLKHAIPQLPDKALYKIILGEILNDKPKSFLMNIPSGDGCWLRSPSTIARTTTSSLPQELTDLETSELLLSRHLPTSLPSCSDIRRNVPPRQALRQHS